ncbi:MAG: hypothetical protein L0H25_09780 [Micrococcales bacterium]|nr:hypothetical protein [Micrococcales bacterium]
MKVVLLTTLRAQRPSWFLQITEQLALADRPDAEVSVVSAHRPNWPLPASRHVLAGSRVSLRDTATSLRVAAPANTADLAAPTDAGPGDPTESSGEPLADVLSDPVGESLTEAMTGSLTEDPSVPLEDAADPADEQVEDDDLAPVRPQAGSVLHLPVYHPRRMVKAASWRANKVRLTMKKHPGLARVRASTRLRKVRTAVGSTILPGGISDAFALSCVRCDLVGELVGSADVVVALDASTHRAAWLLARRHPRPAVIAGTAAAKRVIEELDPGSPRSGA